MKKLEVFFDYACPYCLRAHKSLMDLLPEFPEVEIVWNPCESHPRPDRYGPHSDLCIRGYFFAAENDVDLLEYHDRMYRAALIERIEIESIDALTEYNKDLVDAEAFRTALIEGKYCESLAKANELAFEQSGVWAVPAYRMEGRKLDAIEDIGVTKEQLRKFLAE